MYAIQTKYLGYTNFKSSRVKAFVACASVKASVTLEYDQSKSATDNHDAVALALATKMKWHGKFCRGDVGDGFVYVPLTGEHDVAFIRTR